MNRKENKRTRKEKKGRKRKYMKKRKGLCRENWIGGENVRRREFCLLFVALLLHRGNLVRRLFYGNPLGGGGRGGGRAKG